MNFLGGSFRIGRLFGIDIHVHFIMVLWIGFQLFGSGDIADSMLFYGLLFGIVLLHEFGHCFGARAVGGDAENIMLWPLGGLAFAHAPMRPWPQFVTVAAGPLVNVFFCLLSGALISYYSGGLGWINLNPLIVLNGDALPESQWLNYVVIFYWVNYWLFAFNMLPVYPLDGGQMLQTILWPFMGLRNSTMLACQIGIGGAIFAGVWAVQRMQGGGSGGILFFIALFGGYTCWQRYQAAKYGMLVEDRDYRVYKPSDRPGGVGGFFSRIFGNRKPRTPTAPKNRTAAQNPNPGGWDRKQEKERSLGAEVDRILKKVSDQGIQSLSYPERQTLERASRAKREQEAKLEKQFRE